MSSSDMADDTNPGQAIVELADLVEADLIDEHGVIEECHLLAKDLPHVVGEDLTQAVGREVMDRDNIGDYANGVGEILEDAVDKEGDE